MTDMPITLERVRQSKWSLMAHLNMGRNGHVMVHRCIDFPRLTVSRLSRRGAPGARKIVVDGTEVESLAAAVAALSQPPPADAPKEPLEMAAHFVDLASPAPTKRAKPAQLELGL